MRAKHVAQSLKFLFSNRFPALLVGPPGIGKTELVKQAAAKLKIPLIVSHPVVKEPTDYKGLPAVFNGVADFLPFGDLRLLMNAKTLTIFFMDDLGQASPAVQAAAMQLVLERSIDGKAVSDNIIFAAATNRFQDNAGVRQFLAPLKDRYYDILNVEVHAEDWLEWANENSILPELIAFIRFRNDLLFEPNPSREIVKVHNPRSIFHVNEILRCSPPKHLEKDLIAGAAGQAFCVEFTNFLEVSRHLPSPAQVFRSPRTVDLPEELSAQYAMVGALANAVEVHTFSKLLVYLDRLPKELNIMCVRDAAARKPAIAKSRKFDAWLEENMEVMTS